jgi:ribulose bisphosphate carboxylase small subunit
MVEKSGKEETKMKPCLLYALYWFLCGFFFDPEDAGEVFLLLKDALSSAGVPYRRLIGEDSRWRF